MHRRTTELRHRERRSVLCLESPARAAVFSFDEKTQVQVLGRTQPSLPLRVGRARTITHDYRLFGNERATGPR